MKNSLPPDCIIRPYAGYFTCESKSLELIGTGETEAEAVTSFGEELAYFRRLFEQLDDSRLSERLRRIKRENLDVLMGRG